MASDNNFFVNKPEFQEYGAQGLQGRGENAAKDDVVIMEGIHGTNITENLKKLFASISKALIMDSIGQSEFTDYLNSLLYVNNIETLNQTGLIVAIKTKIRCKKAINYSNVEKYFMLTEDEELSSQYNEMELENITNDADNFINYFIPTLRYEVDKVITDSKKLTEKKRLAEMAIRYALYINS